MLSRMLIGAASAAGVAAIGVPGVAAADPAPPPAPNVNAYVPVKPSEYAVMSDNWYAFSTPQGATCVLQKTGGYGCSGSLPGAPDGANLVTGQMGGVPGFATTDDPVFGVVEAAKPLPANSRISYQTLSCGTDGTTTTCIDSRNQSGFVISPGGSFILNASSALPARQGSNPFFN